MQLYDINTCKMSSSVYSCVLFSLNTNKHLGPPINLFFWSEFSRTAYNLHSFGLAKDQ